MSSPDRLHALDAVRAAALLLGVIFHAGFSFVPGLPPGLWAFTDPSPSPAIGVLLFVLHIFRMSLFFFVAGFFARLLFQRGGARGFWTNRAKRILVPLVAGWVLLFPTLTAIWIWGLTRMFGGTLPSSPSPAAAHVPAPPAGAFPLTHLWFLYYLLVLYAIVLAGRALIVTLDRRGTLRHAIDAIVRGAVRSGAAVLLLALPVALALYAHANWIAWFGIPTPDRSLIPEWPSLIGFGTALTFGWLVHRQPELLQVWRAQWPWHTGAALAATAICLTMAGATPILVPAPPGARTLAYALGYGLAIWCWNFAVIGIAMRFLAHANRAVRYVADASYWIYLVHLPIVIALQILVGALPWHWSLKFPLILALAGLLLGGSYHYLVRATFIGQVLNGRRYPRSSRAHAHVAVAAGAAHAARAEQAAQAANAADAASAVDVAPAADATAATGASADTAQGDSVSADAAATSAAPTNTTPIVAALRGVHHRYGKTVALAGLDLDVQRGELLAVLGPNGAGKSTAIALWLGLLEPDEGTARLFDRSPFDVDSRRHVGVMMQDVGLTPELRVRELIALTASYYPRPLSTAEAIARAGITAIADRPYARLSGGQKRQVQFALAICGRPSLLFLDEPTVGLDVPAREALWRTLQALRAEGCAMVLTTHYLEEAEALADRAAVVANGRLIACGSVAEVRSLVSRKQVSCTTTLTADTVRAWPGVVAVTATAATAATATAAGAGSGQRLRLTVVDAEAIVRRLLASDEQLRDLEVVQASLADAFTKLTMEAA